MVCSLFFWLVSSKITEKIIWKDEQPFGCIGKSEHIPRLHKRLRSNSWSTSQSTILPVRLSRATRWKFPFSATLAESERHCSCTKEPLFLFTILRCYWDIMKNSEQNLCFNFPCRLCTCCQRLNLGRLGVWIITWCSSACIQFCSCAGFVVAFLWPCFLQQASVSGRKIRKMKSQPSWI